MCYVRTGMWMPNVENKIQRSYVPFKVRVGHDSLVGEVIRIEADKATVQVYEETGKGNSFSGARVTG